MSDTIARVLDLLGLLQSRSVWSGQELADRLGVTDRTLRRDIARVRELGYRVDSVQGVAGGYRMRGGGVLPPLVLDDDEAVALVACLRMGALDGSDAVGESALRALSKLDPLLPASVRAKASAVDAATTALPSRRPSVDADLLATLSRALRDSTLVRFRYARADGEAMERSVEPGRLLTQGTLWYLVAFDRDRDDWRTFRLDRMSDLRASTLRFTPRPVDARAVDWAASGRWPHEATVRLWATPQRIRGRIAEQYLIQLDEGSDHCDVRVGAPSLADLAWHMAWIARDLDARLAIVEGEGMQQAMATLARQMTEYAQLAEPR